MHTASLLSLFGFFVGITLSAGFTPPSIEEKPTTTAPTTLILSDGTRIHCEIPKSTFAVSNAVIANWVESNACAIRTFYGKYPVRELLLILRPVEGSSEISYGNAFPGKTLQAAPRITIYVGTEATSEEFRTSWVLCHEMTHLTFPSLEREHHWLEEGIATYVEPIARAMTGLISIESVWYDLMKNAPRSVSNDYGLDGAEDFGRVYWGGALFCLLSDLEIRRATANKHSFQDALRAIMQRQGTINIDRDINAVLRCGDSAVGAKVLVKLYAQMGKAPYNPNLENLWQDLGIERAGETVRFRDDAPLAAVRRSVCSRLQTSCSPSAQKH